jgi:hypothetical protein
MGDAVDYRAIVLGYVIGASQRDSAVCLGYGKDLIVVGRNDNLIYPLGL